MDHVRRCVDGAMEFLMCIYCHRRTPLQRYRNIVGSDIPSLVYATSSRKLVRYTFTCMSREKLTQAKIRLCQKLRSVSRKNTKKINNGFSKIYTKKMKKNHHIITWDMCSSLSSFILTCRYLISLFVAMLRYGLFCASSTALNHKCTPGTRVTFNAIRFSRFRSTVLQLLIQQ